MENSKPKTIPEEIEALHNLPSCKHCKNNSHASKPFSEMKNVKLTPLSEKVLEETAKQYDIEPNCLICLSIKNFLKMPWNQQLELLKGKN